MEHLKNVLDGKAYITVPQSVSSKEFHKTISHGFADASKLALCAAVYLTCVVGTEGVRQNLLVAKLRVAPRNTSATTLKSCTYGQTVQLSYIG